MSDLLAAAPIEKGAEDRAPSLHDSVLINVAGAMLVDFGRLPEQIAEDLELMARVLPLVSRDMVRMRDLADACERMVLHADWRRRRAREGEINLWERAWFDARLALAAVFRWRTAKLHSKLGGPT